MSFAAPLLLAALAAAPLALALLWLLWRRRRLHLLAVRGRGGAAVVQGARRGGPWPAALLCAALALLALAAARPQFGNDEAALQQQPLGVVFVLDASRSMAAGDVQPSRFEAAVSELRRLIDSQRTTRVGLVIFAGTSFVRFPLTLDHESALAVLGALQPGESLLQPGSNIAAAIAAAHDLLRRAAGGGAIVVVSDGEVHEGDAALAARRAADDGLRVFAAGVGTELGAAVPAGGPGSANRIDARTGREVVSRLDATGLQTIAAAGRGRYVQVAAPGAMDSLAADFAALERARPSGETAPAPREQFQWFAAAALTLLLGGPLIRLLAARGAPGALRRLAAAALLAGLAALLLSACAASGAARANQQGNEHFAAERYQEALESYREAQRLAPDDAVIQLNIGRVLHALGEFQRAETATLGALRSDAPSVRALAMFHAGNHRWAAGDLLGARAAFAAALREQHDLLDAKVNLEIVNRLLEAAAEQESRPPLGLEGGEEGGGEAEGEGGQSGAGDAGEESSGAPGGGAGVEQADGVGAAGPGAPSFEEQDRPAQRQAAEAALRAALELLPLENAGLEQALAVLDALRAAPDERFASGQYEASLEGIDDW